MSSPTLAHTNGKMNGMNGSTPTQDSWLQQTVHQFFTAFNWEGHSPEVQELKLTALQGSDASLSLTLTVTQFFGAIAWDGSAIATTPSLTASTTPSTEDFTLEDFSDLF
ncbi:MAG: hypothetical protein HC899_00410 [Leptolyngbyaceae cyanobacterium SM1_4_3]|nr:hypothetical protein [Leptolyngbyaceae cyanobacterium SM1_4_3]